MVEGVKGTRFVLNATDTFGELYSQLRFMLTMVYVPLQFLEKSRSSSRGKLKYGNVKVSTHV